MSIVLRKFSDHNEGTRESIKEKIRHTIGARISCPR